MPDILAMPQRRACLKLALASAAGTAVAQPTLRLRGSGRLRVLGFAVYDATLWAADPFDPDAFAASELRLELSYLRDLRSQAIVERSLDEMALGGPLPAARLPAWRSYLQRAIPDVLAGQRLAAHWQPGTGNTRLWQPPDGTAQDWPDAEFGPRFLGIWLAAHSSQPALRRRLLGLA
jgi:hypothetical protein